MKICIIKQPAGLGDILFCQKIAAVAKKQFHCNKVIWPVCKSYSNLCDYIQSESNFLYDETFNFPQSYNIINDDNILYIPLDTSDRLVTACDPRAHGHIKYKFFYDTDFTDWKQYFTIKRNYDREERLRKKLNINYNEDYNFVNCNFGTPPNFVTYNIKPKNNYKNVYMQIYADVNIFDWLGILENAKEIHTMETSLYYLIEKLNIENNIYIYSKFTAQQGIVDDYNYMRSHCSAKWNYV